MKVFQAIRTTAAPAAALIPVLALLVGCSRGWLLERKPPTPPLGVQSDMTWRRQEVAGAASSFVVYQHEFELNGVRLNADGEDHVKSIAVRLRAGAPMPVIVEKSMTGVDPASEHKFPIHANPELDMKRRDVVVRSLVGMGVPNADQCVVVAPPLAEGYTAGEAIRAYERGMTAWGHTRGGYGNRGGIGVGGSIH